MLESLCKFSTDPPLPDTVYIWIILSEYMHMLEHIQQCMIEVSELASA